MVVMHSEQAWDGDFRLKRDCRGSIPKINIYGDRDGCSHDLETAQMEGDTGRALRALPSHATAPGPQIARFFFFLFAFFNLYFIASAIC